MSSIRICRNEDVGYWVRLPEDTRNYHQELQRIADALANSVLEMSDEDVLAEAAEDGEDIEATAESVRQVFRRAIENQKNKQPALLGNQSR